MTTTALTQLSNDALVVETKRVAEIERRSMADLLCLLPRQPTGGHVSRQVGAFEEAAMTRRDWWMGILVLVAAFVAHAAMNRYSWHLYTVEGAGQNARALLRIDRFTGAVTHEPVPRLDLEGL